MPRKLKIGLIGTSWWAELMYLPSFASHPEAEVAAICGRDTARAKELAARFSIPQTFSDYREMIARSGAEAVVISVPDDLHLPMALAAIDSGLHVLCEKPLANNAADARLMRDRAVAAGVHHMVLFTWRWQPHWRYVKRLVDEGYVGRVHAVRIQFLLPFSNGTYQWRFDGERSNGVLSDCGSHMIDLLQWMVGDVTAVSARLRTVRPAADRDGRLTKPVNDEAFLTLNAGDGVVAQIDLSAAEQIGDRGARVRVGAYGDKGAVEGEHIFFGSEGGATVRGITAGDEKYRTLAIPDDLAAGVDLTDLMSPYRTQPVGPRLFVDAVLNGTPPIPDFNAGFKAQEVIDAALRSAAERRWIDVR